MDIGMREITRPSLDVPAGIPDIPGSVYRSRIDALRQRMTVEGYDAIVVYGDREHYGNLAYISGYDPRFEEALFVLTANGDPNIVVGNEGEGYVGISPLDLRVHLLQSLSLVDQDRSQARLVEDVLAECGVDRGMRVGLVGWKYFVRGEVPQPDTASEVPSFIVDAARRLCRDELAVRNATALFIAADDGLRTRSEAAQIAAFEATQAWASSGIWQALEAIGPGMTEHEVASHYGYRGQALNYHPIVTTGQRTETVLASPSARRLERADRAFLAFGGWGANTVRAGFVADGPADLPADQPDYVSQVVEPYFAAVATWYEAIRIDADCGAITDAMTACLGGAITSWALNPGHHTHLDEWVSSPFYDGTRARIRSGMVLQMDMIPVTRQPYFSTNAEDGIAVADEALRSELATDYPDAWRRIQARREHMREELGIELAEEVLPLSNIQGILPPFLMRPTWAMHVERR